MKEQFDKRLVEKIKDSFDRHEEAFDPVQWEKFSQAYLSKPRKQRKMAYWPFWISGVAASLLLVFLFFPFEKEIEQGVSTLKGNIATKSKSLDHISKPSEGLAERYRPDEAGKNKVVRPLDDLAVDQAVVNTETKSSEREMYEAIQTGKDTGFDGIIVLDDRAPSLELPAHNIVPLNGESAASEGNGFVVQRPSETMDENAAKNWVEDWKNGQDPGKSTGSSETVVKNERAKNPFRLGVMGGPQAASNPVSGMQFGGGLVSEFSLSDKLKLDIGLTYAQQRMEPNRESKLPEAMTLRSANAMETASSFTNNYLGSEYTFSYSGLDIPVNLKYKVMDKSNANLYLITGLSSMVYFDQEGRETFSVESRFSSDFTGALQFTESIQQYTEEYAPGEGDSNVDLGKMLNLSFGYEYNLKNGTFISIEPYYKLPLGDLTFTNQQFSIGGLNLRMNFQFKK
ncbi:hypothetical protein GCM10028791_00420 [Echinicola sediminis]